MELGKCQLIHKKYHKFTAISILSSKQTYKNNKKYLIRMLKPVKKITNYLTIIINDISYVHCLNILTFMLCLIG